MQPLSLVGSMGEVGGGRTKDKEQKVTVSGGLCGSRPLPASGAGCVHQWAGLGAADSGGAWPLSGPNGLTE